MVYFQRSVSRRSYFSTAARWLMQLLSLHRWQLFSDGRVSEASPRLVSAWADSTSSLAPFLLFRQRECWLDPLLRLLLDRRYRRTSVHEVVRRQDYDLRLQVCCRSPSRRSSPTTRESRQLREVGQGGDPDRWGSSVRLTCVDWRGWIRAGQVEKMGFLVFVFVFRFLRSFLWAISFCSFPSDLKPSKWYIPSTCHSPDVEFVGELGNYRFSPFVELIFG